ncbi:HAD family hydrolase [Amycolatopsis viridis]|uniref:HAD superfamily hydrolase (TIGR01490 family) n=1 Tax=Amycolatopsis viridis TaxID=185678 RepID=A0ABX0SMA6_9PSEU|nr:HAD-IB family hydrolase [Amycolatopsis viridis]NIH78106.1 HAD superfamily hydrolase (TIGR01490 family) [Amycolatopsis viridis]
MAEPSTSPPSDQPAAPGTGVAAFFDLDKTIIASSSALAFSKPLLREGLISKRAALKSAYAQFVFSLSGADADRTERMRAEISALCKGWDVAQVRAIVNETLHDIVDPLVYAEAAELITWHREQGHDVIVLSAAGDEVVAPIAAMLGATASVATRMGVVDGRYSGEIAFYCYGEQKAVAAKQLAVENGYELAECYAYSDSSTDVPLLETVGRPHAVNPDRLLRRTAAEHGWPVLEFTKPVSLRSRFPAPSPATLAVGLGLGAVAAAGVTWYGLTRKRRGGTEKSSR